MKAMKTTSKRGRGEKRGEEEQEEEREEVGGEG